MTLSAADAAKHAIENPYLHDALGGHQMLVTVVILTAIIPTLIAERWFDPGGKPAEERWPDNRPPGQTPSGSSR